MMMLMFLAARHQYRGNYHILNSILFTALIVDLIIEAGN